MARLPLADARELATNFYTFEGVVRALNGVSFVVNRGETYGLVGESGCGKSVTVRSLMRIVQAPGRIESGRIVLFFNDEARTRGIEILQRSEAYMESVRGSDISMIFQEPGAALNPVLSVLDQVGESYRFHRMEQMISETVARLEDERTAMRGGSPRRAARHLQAALLRAERAGYQRFADRVGRIDDELYRLEGRTDAEATDRKESLNRSRDRARLRGGLASVARRVPILRRYRRPLDATIRGHVVKLLRSLGIPNPENVVRRFPHELSGGMQQRIVIAIALACHPTLLVADEPTSNLDVTIQAQIVELIRELKRSTISSVLFITHDLGLVAEICDRVTVMYAGDVSETAPVRDLFRSPFHPYTQGLLASVPKAEQRDELAMIPGAVPNLIRPPKGCRFHPRCPKRMDICGEVKPPTVERTSGHWVACHLYTGGRSA